MPAPKHAGLPFVLNQPAFLQILAARGTMLAGARQWVETDKDFPAKLKGAPDDACTYNPPNN